MGIRFLHNGCSVCLILGRLPQSFELLHHIVQYLRSPLLTALWQAGSLNRFLRSRPVQNGTLHIAIQDLVVVVVFLEILVLVIQILLFPHLLQTLLNMKRKRRTIREGADMVPLP
jgi:hypothetical protein